MRFTYSLVFILSTKLVDVLTQIGLNSTNFNQMSNALQILIYNC